MKTANKPSLQAVEAIKHMTDFQVQFRWVVEDLDKRADLLQAKMEFTNRRTAYLSRKMKSMERTLKALRLKRLSKSNRC